MLRSTSKYFLGSYNELRPGPNAAGEKAKKKVKKQTQPLANLSVQERYPR